MNFFHSPALEYYKMIDQYSSLHELHKQHKAGEITIEDFAFEVMLRKPDSMSVLLFRVLYQEMKDNHPEKLQALRTTSAAYYARATMYDNSTGFREQEMRQARYARFAPGNIIKYWFASMAFQFLDCPKEEMVRVEFHRTHSYAVPFDLTRITTRLKEGMKDVKITRVDKRYFELPKHIAGMLLLRSNQRLKEM